LWIIVEVGLGPGFTRSDCELLGDFSSAESNDFGGEDAVGKVIGFVDELGAGGGGRECISGEGLEIRAVFSAVVLAAASKACLSAFCCLRILSTIYIPQSAPHYMHYNRRTIVSTSPKGTEIG
jgi:hypothetical protein